MRATILIPTYNRPKELKRLLHFLQFSQNPYPVVVLDGSTAENQKINRENIRDFKLVIAFPFDPGMHLGTRLAIGLNEHVNTDYAILCGDDDFIIPQTITQAITFLQENPEYSAVNGYVKCLAHPKNLSHLGLFAFLDDLKHPLVLEHPEFLARFLKLNAIAEAGCPPLFYALRRTAQAREIFAKIPATLKYSSQEMLSNALTVLWGKVTTLPSIMAIRNYSCEATRDEIREDPTYIISPEDAVYIRETLGNEIRKINTTYSNEIINYTLDQFIKLPLTKFTSSKERFDVRSPFAKTLAYKKNWISYLVNLLFPGFNEKLDTSIKKNIVIALKKAFKSQGR
ncbi:MAG: TIGR00180 family glycosyltransferase [Candidatus Berkiellales bacterium]